MKFRNKKTKAEINTEFKISGGAWEEVKEEKNKTKKAKADGTDDE